METIRIVLESLAVLAFVAGLLNEKKIIRLENRMIGKVRRNKGHGTVQRSAERLFKAVCRVRKNPVHIHQTHPVR